MTSLYKTASWVIVSLDTNQAVTETYNWIIAQAVDPRVYKAVPILEYLQSLNEKRS